MSQEHLTYDDLLRIVELIKSSEQFSEFRLKVGEIEIELRRRRPGDPAAAPASSASEPVARTVEAPEPPAPDPRQAPAPRAASAAPPWQPGASVVRAPMIGTFYRSPQPGAPPFVTVGQGVEPDTIVCIIEVMKLMNSIPAGVRGVVSHVLVEDGASVEAGAPLVVVAPEHVP